MTSVQKFTLLLFIPVIIATQGCSNDDEPGGPGVILIAGEAVAFEPVGKVLDRKLNEDNSYQMEIRLNFGSASYILFTVNSENERFFRSGEYMWSPEARTGTVTAASLFLPETNQQFNLQVESFSVDSSREPYIISFALSGDIVVTGTFNGDLEFQERYVTGTGSFELDGNSFNTPYFGMSEVIENSDNYYLARLYFYNVDPSNPFLAKARSHSLYLTIVQATPDKLQPGTYGITESVRPFSLIDGKPLIESDNYQFEGGSVIFSQTDSIYNVSYTLNIMDGTSLKSVTGTYTGKINNW